MTSGFLNSFFKLRLGFARARFKRPPEECRDERELDRKTEKPILAANEREEYRIHDHDRGKNRGIQIPLRYPIKRLPKSFCCDAKKRQCRNNRENSRVVKNVSVINNGISIATTILTRKSSEPCLRNDARSPHLHFLFRHYEVLRKLRINSAEESCLLLKGCFAKLSMTMPRPLSRVFHRPHLPDDIHFDLARIFELRSVRGRRSPAPVRAHENHLSFPE